MEDFLMNKSEYKKLVDKITPKPNKMKNAIISFLIGGFIGLLAEIINHCLQDKFAVAKEDALIWTLIIFILLASLFTALRFFDTWVAKVKAGLIVPITGFAHSITSAAMDYKQDGMITGLGANFFKLAGSVLLFGTVSAFILVILKVIIYG